MKQERNSQSRRKFFVKSTKATLGAIAGASIITQSCSPADSQAEMVKVLTPDGTLVEVDKKSISTAEVKPHGNQDRVGVPDRKFVMVIDLARCRNARKCISKCQEMHHLRPEDEWIKVFLMQDSSDTSPYWFPKPCFHCNQPPCVKVCPVGATYKRQDGLVMVDNERCIGCKFCMTACPYSSRVFQWNDPDKHTLKDDDYSVETSVPHKVGTVGKCDFCPDMARKGKLPVCVTSCPNGVIYFGDKNEDIVSNGTETVRFSQLVHDRAGYHFMAELGTEPNLYYLPPVNRLFDYEKGFNTLSEEQAEFYKKSIVTKH